MDTQFASLASARPMVVRSAIRPARGPFSDPGRAARVPTIRGANGMMMALAVVLTLCFAVTAAPAHAGYASIVVDAGTGKVLHASNADTRNYPASLTKMMTLYLLFEALEEGKLKTTDRIKVSSTAAGQPPSKLGLKPGTGLLVEHAIKALVTKSANDVAVVVAEALGGTQDKFAEAMTRKARELGMTRTTFRNASGLPNNGQMSTARDMAVLSMALIKHFPQYYPYFATTSFRFGNRTIRTHNHVVTQYRGADGLKTGYIRASGFNVASSAVRNGQRLIAVVFGGRTARSRDKHMMELLDEGFGKLAVAAAPIPPAPGPKPAAVADAGGAAETRAQDVAYAAGDQQELPQDMGSADDAPLPAPPKPIADATGEWKDIQQVAMVTSSGDPLPLVKPGSTTAAAAPPVKGSWGVQVGAYSHETAAQKAAEAGAEMIRAATGRPVAARVLPHKATHSTLYRARVLGLLDEKQAQSVCASLKSQNRSCLVVLPSGSSMALR